MISTYTTNFIGSDGVDLGSKLLTKERFNEYYLNIANQYITPELWVWGNGNNGMLGRNNEIGSDIPVTTFVGGANWKQVSCSIDYAFAIKTDGTLWGWGTNDLTQLGINVTGNRSTPVTTFAGGNNWKQISCGFEHNAAIKTDGTLWVWGIGTEGRLGTNDQTSRSTPVTTFAGGNNWKQVSCGNAHTAAVKTDGTLWVWGENSYGGIGDNTTAFKLTPVSTFLGGNDWKQVSSGFQSTAAIKTDGTLWSWGDNSRGQLGNNTTTDSLTPVTTFIGGNNWKQVSCGLQYTAAIKTDGTLWTWGDNNRGCLGTNGAQNSVRTPITTFAGGNNWKQVSLPPDGSLSSAIKTDGTLWLWGGNVINYGQLGNNTTTDSLTPVTTFAGGNNWKQVDVGALNAMAIRSYDD